jgi:predicted amidohydrolase
VIDPANKRDAVGDVLVLNGVIASANSAVPADIETLDISTIRIRSESVV